MKIRTEVFLICLLEIYLWTWNPSWDHVWTPSGTLIFCSEFGAFWLLIQTGVLNIAAFYVLFGVVKISLKSWKSVENKHVYLLIPWLTDLPITRSWRLSILLQRWQVCIVWLLKHSLQSLKTKSFQILEFCLKLLSEDVCISINVSIRFVNVLLCQWWMEGGD